MQAFDALNDMLIDEQQRVLHRRDENSPTAPLFEDSDEEEAKVPPPEQVEQVDEVPVDVQHVRRIMGLRAAQMAALFFLTSLRFTTISPK